MTHGTSKKCCTHETLQRSPTGGWYCNDTAGCDFVIPEPDETNGDLLPEALAMLKDDVAEETAAIEEWEREFPRLPKWEPEHKAIKRLTRKRELIAKIERSARETECSARWISVAERLPEVGTPVVYYFGLLGPYVGKYLEMTEFGAMFGGKQGFLTGDVTHWMPLLPFPTPEKSTENLSVPPASPTEQASLTSSSSAGGAVPGKEPK